MCNGIFKVEMGGDLGVESLQGQVAIVPGGKDKEGRPILLVTIPAEAPPSDILPTLKYLLSIFSEEGCARGILVVLDARKGPWKTARSYIRQINRILTPNKSDQLVVIKPDGFWDKQRVENCTSTQNDVEVIFTQQSRINKYIDQPQLPLQLGGCYIYNHEQWVDNRLKAEEFFKTSAMVIKHLEEFHQHLLNNQILRANEVDDALNNNNTDIAESIRTMSQRCFEAGQELLTKIEYDNRNRKLASETESTTTPQDILDAIHKTDIILSKLRFTQNQIDEALKQAEKLLLDTKDFSLLTQGIVNVINWILGPAENLLNSQVRVGCDVTSAEELRNAHEAIELKCWDAYGMYAELLYKINSFSRCEIGENQKNDLLWQKDFMDFVCRSFATRLERRRNVLITSLRFFRMVSEYFDRTSDVFESLVMGYKVDDFSTAKTKLLELQENQHYLDAVEREIAKEGEKLSDILSMPIKDAFGRELHIDYSEDIINIRDILDATNARKNLFCDSVELQKLTLEQVTHIDVYEKDAIQAIQWLDELFQVMLQDHGHVGITVHEIQSQKYEHQTFQETAKDTYNYGCQLLNASLALRQSCKLPTQGHLVIHQQLNYSWQRFISVSQEQMTRLRVSAIFHRSVDDHCNQLRDLREAVATMPLEEMFKKQNRVRNFFSAREVLLVEVGRMVRLGKLLRSRLRTPIYLNDTLSESSNSEDSEKASSIDDPSVEDNTIAIEAISEKLLEVTGLAEELDQALRSAQQDCGLLITYSSTTSSTSTSPTTVISMSTNNLQDLTVNQHENTKFKKPEDIKSDEEFLTASDCTLPHSRSSSYNTASECEQMYAPWWEHGKKDLKPGISKEKMVLGVGVPELPPAKDVLKSSPEVPPGKIVREVTETTHLKVRHSHSIGVASYVLTSEVAKESDTAASGLRGENRLIRASDTALRATVKEFNEEDFGLRLQECGDWLQLKILEVNPELTTLGDSLTEAEDLQRAHDEVLRQLQNKQSPVEELLRQADQLISTQKPRTEVYAAMAESLGRAWKDVNLHLDLRKQILDLNVQYHTKAREFFNKIEELEAACTDTVVPIDIESLKEFLTKIHDIRRLLLESLMGALQSGNSILGKLRELGAESTLDSRPDRIRCSVNRAITQVQGWLDKLHGKRQILELTFTSRKTQLEQCLALAMLASDLKDVEEEVTKGRDLLRNTYQLGDSSASTELLFHEHNKLLPQAKQLQERALKITKATERLVASGCFAGEKATEQAYKILSMTSDYLAEIDQRTILLERIIAFFKLAHTALNKLDQFEIQIKTSDLPSISPQLAQLHSQCSRAVEEITLAPLAEGYSILEAGRPGAEGVKRMVEELENRKIYLDGLCTAHREEKLRVNQALNNFLETQNTLYSWLITAAEAFLQGHQDMGSDLRTAKEFWDLHNRLLVDLQTKGNEINSLLLTLPPILEYLEDSQRIDVDFKVEELHQLWLKLKNILETRLDLSSIYVKFHGEADIVNKEIDKLEDSLSKASRNLDDATITSLEEKWESLIPLYQSAKNTGLTFINEANTVSEPYLDTKRACVCVESVLERLSGRQLVVTRNWQSFHTSVVERREIQVQLEINMVESSKTINWVSKLDSQLYPVITTNSANPKEITAHLEHKLQTVYPDIRRAQNEVEQRIKTTESLFARGTSATDEQSLNIKNKLIELNQKLVEITTEYQVLLQMLIAYFNNIIELDKTTNNLNQQYDKPLLPQSVSETETLLREFDSSKQTILKLLQFTQNESDTLVSRINRQEPKEAANQDIEKLKYILEIRKNKWDNESCLRRDALESHKQICQFNFDLTHINEALDDVSRQLTNIKGQYGQSTVAAKATSQAFISFERTVQMLGQRIETFVNASKKLLQDSSTYAPLIEKQIKLLQERWNTLVTQVHDTRRLLDLSIEFFQLVDEADEWFKQGSHILVTIARKATTVKEPYEAEILLQEIEDFLKPGEVKQNDRIARITVLANQLYDKQLSSKTSEVVVANHDMIESFVSVTQELQTLTKNLKASQEERERVKRDQEQLNAKLAEAKAEAQAAEAALKAAEYAKKAAETATKELNEKLIKTVEIVENVEFKREIPVAAAEKPRIKEPEVYLEAPVFTVPLVDATIKEGSKFVFVCKVTGVPMPVVVWHKDGISIQNNPDYQTSFDNGTCTLQIEETFVEDSARYICRATNAAGTAETGAVLSVKEPEPKEVLVPPKFVKHLEPVFLKEGQIFQFECIVEGNPLPTVQWFKNSECIDYLPDFHITYNNGAAVLKFEQILLEHKAEYTCKASNQVGIAQTTANINVEPAKPNESPNFIIPLSNIMARAGQKLKLECELCGLPEPTVTWTHDGKLVKETSELKFQKDGRRITLTISEAFPKDAGTYTVTATNIAGQASSESNVTVKGRLPTETSDSELASDMEPIKPSIHAELKDASVFEGKKAVLECVIIGQPEPEVIWYHNGQPVKESSDFQLLFQGDRCSLVIQEALIEDAGAYKVVALNSAGEASSSCTLTVMLLSDTETTTKPTEQVEKPVGSPPKFSKLLSDVLVSEGGRVIFEGTVMGEPRPEIKWLLNNHDLVSNDHVKISYDDDCNVKLEIEKVIPEDKGVYTVKATNPVGDAKCFAQLIVKSLKPVEVQKEYEEVKIAPSFKELFADCTAFEGTPTKFECIITGKPTPKIKWLFNDEPVAGQNFLISTSGERQVLSVSQLDKTHAGKITCVAENEAGRATCTATLSVQPVSVVILPEREKIYNGDVSESSYTSKREVFMQSSTSSTSKIVTNVTNAAEPQVAERGYIAQDSQSVIQVNQEPPQIKESHLKEEYHKVGQQTPIVHEKSISTVTIGEPVQSHETITSQQITIQKVVKSRPPKFTSPIVGKIVDQGADVVLDGIIDGSPTPTVTWSKNGSEIKSGGNIEISYQNHRVQIKLKNVKTGDSGRYTCTATNDAGTAVSTSDLVVKKTVFPPVFGRRLQAQVVKKGDRVHMEVEVTGTPPPTISWFKDDKPIEDVLKDGYKIVPQGNCYTLIIEKVDFHHTGKYMVRAVNSGGEAQSIADFAVFEPTPDTMVEVVKTVVFEDVHKHETLAQVADQSKTTFSSSKQYPLPIPEPIPIFIKSQEPLEHQVMSKSKFSTVTETKISQESKVMKMESSCSDFSLTQKPLIVTETNAAPLAADAGIETSSISKQSSLDFFVQKLKESEEPVKPKEIPKGAPLQREIYTKFEDIAEQSTYYQPIITKKQEEFSSSDHFQAQQEIPLQLASPPEICYAPRYDVVSKISTIEEAVPTSFAVPIQKPITPQKLTKSDITHTSQSHLSSTTSHGRPTSPRPSAEALEMEKLWVPHKEHDIPKPISRPVSGLAEPSADALAMEKTWAHKFSEISTESSSTWPQPPPKLHEEQSWSAQTTLEKKWAPIQQKVDVPHYVAHVTDLHETGYTKSESSFSEIRKEHIIEESGMKPSEIIKSWPPAPKPEEQKSYLPERPISVQDITNEVYLEPGPPVEISFAPAPREIYTAPPLPPKQDRPLAPPLPARPIKHVEPPKTYQIFQESTQLPYKSEIDGMTHLKSDPVAIPSRFKKGKITDSDYESDLDAARIQAKWKPISSDTEEPSYRKVHAPVSSSPFRSRSVEPEPLPPSKSEQPPYFIEQAKPTVEYENSDLFKKQQVKKQGKQYTRTEPLKREMSPPHLKPGSPPEYLQAPLPKIVDGYMADTDEPFTLRRMTSSESSQQKIIHETHSNSKPAPPKVYRKHTTSSTAIKKELVSTPLVSSTTIQHKSPLPPSPSKFITSEFRESDYESEHEARFSSVSEVGYKSVRPNLTSGGRYQTEGKIPTPSKFDQPPQFSGPPRPKFEPIEKPHVPVRLNTLLNEKTVYKPKPVTPKTPVMDIIVATPAVPEKSFVLQPGSPPEIGYAPAPQATQYYRSTTSAPYQNAVQTETSNVMHFNESTEHSHRTVSLQQTRKVITFGQKDNVNHTKVPPPATPTKFIKGEFRESDYDSEVENSKIKPKWAPADSDTDEPRYRKVKAPQGSRTYSSHALKERIMSPMEFDKGPATFTKTFDSTDSETTSKQLSKYITSQQISKPEHFQSSVSATKLASRHMEDMTQTFKTKTQQFSSDIMSDVHKRSAERPKPDGNAQVYREESRAAQYGTKHVDPDTGLIYFKYDFGYEFGVVLPGQSKGGEIPFPKKTITEPPKRTRDIEMPVHHETTHSKQNSFHQTPKTVKWESESEMSEYEGESKKKPLSYKTRWEQSSTSPASLSPSLPSTSPAFNAAGYRGVETPTSAPETPVNLTVVTHAKRPPLFITPLRDIAVVSGQSARFECIVQSETIPTILWSKNGRIVENSNNHQIHYRNGVCRLTIPQAFPEDAGTYTCSAGNQMGSVVTTATLEVPGERRSQYIK